MSVDRKEIDLIIRAALQGGKTLDGVTKSISDIEKALDLQTAAAKRGESSIDQLKATLESLKQAQNQLKDQAGLIGQFQRLTVQVAESGEKTAKAATAFAAYKEKLDKAGTATDYQSARLIKLASASERSQVSLAKQRTDLDGMGLVLREAGIEMDKLGEAETRARQAAAQLGATINRTHEAISTYAEDVKNARKAEQFLGEQKAFDQKIVDAAKLNKAGEYVRMYTNALNERDVAEQKLKVNAALRNTADEAVATARGYKTLGSAAVPSQAGAGLRDTIAGIISPAEQARSTLAGVESEVQKVGAAIAAIDGPISGYRDQVQQLVAAQKAIGQQASLVDSFNRQVAAVRQARSEFSTARASVLQYAEAMRNSSGENEHLSASLRGAQASLASAQKTLRDQIGSAREMRSAMRDAGLATNDLAGTQARLTNAAKSSTASLRDLNAAHDKHGDALHGGNAKFDIFNRGGRTTLSLLQRIRGELLSMAAAYVGVYGAINGANKVLDAYNKKQEIESQLIVVVGNDQKKIAAEYGYVAAQARRLGGDLSALGGAYTKFAANSKLAGRSASEIKTIFEGFAEAGTVMKLSGDRMELVFKALGDMMGKGTVNAEDLKQQLGDNLPGAMGLFQAALKDKFPDLPKAMKEGKVGVENLITVANHLRKTFAEALPTAIDTLRSHQNNLNTEIFEFQNLIAKQGFADEYGKALGKLTTFFKSDEGTKFAKRIAQALSGVVKAVVWLGENISTVSLIVEVFFKLWFGAAMIRAGRSIATFAVGIVELTKKVGLMGVAVKGMTAVWLGWAAVIPILAAVSDALGLTKWSNGMREFTATLEAFQKQGKPTLGLLAALAGYFAGGIGKSKFSAENIEEERLTRIRELYEDIDKAKRSRERVGANPKETAFFDREIANTEKELSRLQNTGPIKLRSKSDLKSEAAAQAEKIKEDLKAGQAVQKQASAEELAARAKAKQDIEIALQAIDAKILKNEKDNLASRIAGIEEEYGRLAATIKKFSKIDPAAAKGFSATLDAYKSQLVEQETRNFEKRLADERDSISAHITKLEAELGRQNKTNLEARQGAVLLAEQTTFDKLADLRAKLAANGKDTAGVDGEEARLTGVVEQKLQIAEMKYYEDSVNAVLEERKAKIETNNELVKGGLLTESEGLERNKKIVQDTQPEVEELVKQGIAFADAMIAAAKPGESTQTWETMKAGLVRARTEAAGLKTELFSAGQINEMLASGASKAFQSMAESIGGAIRGMNSWKDAIAATRNAFLNFAADFLMQIAQMILKTMLLKVLKDSVAGSTSGVGGVLATAFNAMSHHTGGVVGSGGTPRAAKLEWFANAPRYHNGGIPGLAPDEYAAILKKNEEVLTTADPRNVLNGGTAGGAAATSQNLKIINMIDSGSVVSEGLSSQQGEKAFFNFIRANRTGLKQILT